MSDIPKPRTITSRDTRGSGSDRNTESSRSLYNQVPGSDKGSVIEPSRNRMVKSRNEKLRSHDEKRRSMVNKHLSSRSDMRRMTRYNPSRRSGYREPIVSSQPENMQEAIKRRIGNLDRSYHNLRHSKLNLNRIKNEAFSRKMPNDNRVRLPKFNYGSKKLAFGFKVPNMRFFSKKCGFKF